MKKTAFLVALLLSGCVTGSHVATGPVQPPTDAASVKIYAAAPADAQIVGLVSAQSSASLSWQRAKNQAVEKLKREAAKLGANGIVLTDSGEDFWAGAVAKATAIRTN